MSFPIVILGSGRGTNAEALLKSESKKKLGAAKIAAVISDQEEAGILALGQRYQVPAIALDPGRPAARLSKEAEQIFIDRIQSFSPKLIVLAGFMRILEKEFIEAFEGRVINLHPSLLPSFPGMGGIAQAFESGDKTPGCTVHWVTPELDAGPVIAQAAVAISPEDTPQTLQTRVQAIEHQLYPEVVAWLAAGRVRMKDHQVVIDEQLIDTPPCLGVAPEVDKNR